MSTMGRVSVWTLRKVRLIGQCCPIHQLTGLINSSLLMEAQGSPPRTQKPDSGH